MDTTIQADEAQAREALTAWVAEHDLPQPARAEFWLRTASLTLASLDDLARWAAALERPITAVRTKTDPERIALWIDGEPLDFAGRRWDVYGPQIGRTS